MTPFSRTDATNSAILASSKVLRGCCLWGRKPSIGQRKYLCRPSWAADVRRAPIPLPRAGRFTISWFRTYDFAGESQVGGGAAGGNVIQQGRQAMARRL